MDPVQKLRVKDTKRANRRLYAEVCHNYPQYRLEELPDMPLGDLNLLANYARLERTLFAFDVAAAMSQAGAKELRERAKQLAASL